MSSRYFLVWTPWASLLSFRAADQNKPRASPYKPPIFFAARSSFPFSTEEKLTVSWNEGSKICQRVELEALNALDKSCFCRWKSLSCPNGWFSVRKLFLHVFQFGAIMDQLACLNYQNENAITALVSYCASFLMLVTNMLNVVFLRRTDLIILYWLKEMDYR